MYLKETQQKNKDGSIRRYLQIVETHRINGGQPRQKVLVNLGRCDTEAGRQRLEEMAEAIIEASQKFFLLDSSKDLRAEWTKEYGPALIFKKLWKDLGLDEVLLKEFSSLNAEFDVKEAIFNMVLNRLTEPSSKRQLEFWQEGVYGVTEFDSHQYYRAMDYLIEKKDSLEEGIFEQMKSLLNHEVELVLFDTTTLVYYGASENHEELLRKGFSKARRGDLNQVVVGVLMSREGIPLGHEVFSGNQNDVTCFKEIIKKVSKRFKIKKVILVGDRGMISQGNIDYLDSEGYQYILGFRMRTISREERSWVLDKADLESVKNTDLQYKEVEYKGKRLVVCYNSERAELDKAHREEILEKIRQKVDGKSIKSLVTNPQYKKFLKIKGEKPRLDQEKIKQDELYDGVFVLTTNTDLGGLEVVESYRDLWQIEMAFRQLKSEIEMGPIYHWKDRRIRAHIMICFMAFILRAVLYKKLKQEQKEISYQKTMNHLKSLQLIHLKIKNKTVLLRTELKELAKTAFKSLSMRAPLRVHYSDNLSNVVVRH